MPYVLERYVGTHWETVGMYVKRSEGEGEKKRLHMAHPDWTMRLIEILDMLLGVKEHSE